MSISCHFWALGGHDSVWPLGSAFEGHGSPPPVNKYMCMPHEFKRRCLHRLFPKSAYKFSPAQANYITDSNKTFRSRSRGRLIGSDSDSDSWLVATTPGDFDSGSDSAPLVQGIATEHITGVANSPVFATDTSQLVSLGRSQHLAPEYTRQ